MMLLPKVRYRKLHHNFGALGVSIFVVIVLGLLGISWAIAPVIAAPNAPQPILPAEGDAVITPTFSWLPSGGAVKYKIQVGPQSDPVLVYWESTTLNLNLTPVDALPNGLLYWRVGAYLASDTEPSSWSGKVNFSKYIPAPLLNSPPNHIALAGPTFGWDPVAGAAYYQVDITQDSSFNSIDYTYTTYNTSLTPNKTLAHGSFFWRVSGMDAAGHVGTPSDVWSFIKHIPAPMTVAPSNGVELVFPTLEWKATEDTAYYRVEISPNSSFNPIIFTDITYATRLTPKTSLPHGNYFWRVRGVDADGHEGANSAPIAFYKNIPAPELISPASDATIKLPTLDWGPAEGAVSYKVELSVTPSFNNLAASFTTYNTRLTPVQSLAAGVYYWRVRGLDAGGNEGLNSSVRSFTLESPPAADQTTPLLQTPAEGEILSTDPTFRWTPVVGAASYSLKVSASPTFSVLYDSLSTHYTSYTPYSAGIKNAYVNGVYYWKVEARTASNQVIAASQPGSFIKQMPLPLANPSDQASFPGEPTFEWRAVPGAKSYHIQVSKTATFATIYDSVSTEYPIYTPYTPGIIYTYPNGTYYWRVTAHSSSNADLTTSEPRSFTKQVNVYLSGPVNNAVLLTDPMLTWKKVSGAKTYYLKVSKDPTFSTLYDSIMTDYTSYTPFTVGVRDVYVNGDYYWRVEARGSTGQTVIATSQVFKFTKASTILLDRPAEGAILGSTPTFFWGRVVGAKDYYLRVSVKPDFSTSYDAVATDYTSYTPFYPGVKDVYANGAYYWRIEARSNAGAVIATSLARSFTISSSEPTSTPIGAPTATPTLTPTVPPPTEIPPEDRPTPTPLGPRGTAEPPPGDAQVMGSVKVYADTFTDLGDNRFRASGNVRLGSTTAAYVVLGPGEIILDYNAMGIEGSNSSVVSLLLDDNTLAPVFTGSFQVDPSTGGVSTLLNTIFQLTALGDLGVDTGTPLAQFSMNVLQGTVSGQALVTIYSIEGVWPSARVDFTLYHDGSVSGGLRVGDFDFEAAGVTFEVENATLSYSPTEGGKIIVSRASIALPEAFDLGAEGSVEDLVITANGLESVGGGSITLEMPDMAVPGTGGKFELAGASVTLSLDTEGNYYINGRADFSVPNISSKGNPNTTYSGSFYAEFQLDQSGLTYVLLGGEIEPGIPIGQSGFVLTKLEGRVDLSPAVRVQITGTLQTTIEVPPLGPLVSGEPTVWVQLSEPYEIGISGSVKVLIFDAAQASLVLSQSNGLTGSVHVNYFPYAMEGDATLHVWRSGGEFHFTGSATVTLGFHKGALGTFWGIDLPPTDFTFAELSTEFGEFCNDRYCASTVYGFKGAVDLSIDAICPRFGIPPWRDCSFDLFSYAFFIDLNGNLDYGSSLDQYRLAGQAAYLAQAQASGQEPLGSLAITNTMTFTVGVTDLTMVGLDWVNGSPKISLVDPLGTPVYTDTVYPGLGYTSTATSFAYFISDPIAGVWQAVISNLTGAENYTFRALGRNLPPQLSLSGVTAAQTTGIGLGAEAYTIHWMAYDADPDTSLALYYDTDNGGADGTLIAAGLDPAVGSYSWDTTQVQSGEYYLYAKVDDLKNLPVTRYFSQTVTLLNTLAPAAPTGLQVDLSPAKQNIQVCWTLNSETDVVGYYVHFGSQPGLYDIGVFDAMNLSCIDLTVPGWMDVGYIAVSAYDNSSNQSPLSAEWKVVIDRAYRVYLPVVKR